MSASSIGGAHATLSRIRGFKGDSKGDSLRELSCDCIHVGSKISTAHRIS